MMNQRCGTLLLSLVLAATVLAACGGAPAKPSPLQLRISASADANPDLQSRPSPVILHMLELSAIDAFNRASFFELTENDAAALGGDLLGRTEIILTPGSTRESTLELSDRVAYLGFVAAYRDIDNARWRVTHAVLPGKTSYIIVDIGMQRVSVTEVDN